MELGCHKGNNEYNNLHVSLVLECVLFLSFRIHFSRSLFFSSPSVPLSPLMSRHTIHPALVQSTGPSICSIFVASLIYPNTSIFTNFLQNLPFYLRRIKWVSVAELMVLYVIPGFGWVAKLLEGWTNRLNNYGLIYLGLTHEPF